MSDLALLTAALSAEAHYIQASAVLRPPYYAVPEPREIVADATAILALAKQASRAAVKECNGELTERQAASRTAGIVRRAEPFAEKYLASVDVQGDPRGFMFFLRFRSGRSNSFRSGLWGVA